MKIILYIYAIAMAVMSVVAFFSYREDKSLAQKGAFRTPEKKLLLLAACLGGIGAFAGMKAFRHKTKHLRFQIFVPVCMILQLLLLAALIYFIYLKK